MHSVELKSICKGFKGKEVLKNFSLTINKGEMVSLLGSSGCGKSTALKIISGLIKPESGDVLFNGESILNVPAEKRGSVIVFQDYLLFPHMNVEDNIGFGLKMSKMDKHKRRKKISEMIELVELAGSEKKYPCELSGGQQQRTALARALAVEPKVLLLDEPFSNLDQRLRDVMREFVSDLQRKLGITTILVTHDKEEALMLSSRIALMSDGRIEQFGTPDEVYNRPVSLKASRFFCDRSYIKGEINKGRVISCLGEFESDITGSMPVTIMIKSEDVKIYSSESDKGIESQVRKVKYVGDRVYYDLRIGNEDLRCTSDASSRHAAGEYVKAYIDYSKSIIFKE